jgi:hypothetical protein
VTPLRARQARRQRGAGFSEYLILIVVVAILAAAGFRLFGGDVSTNVEREADCLASMDPSACRQGSAVAETGLPLDRSGNPKTKKIKAAEGATYDKATGTPFVKGGDDRAIHPNDVSQGGLGDCYFIASLAAIAHTNPGVLERGIRDRGDGSYVVTFYDPGVFGTSKKEIVVTAEFPRKNGNWVFAQPGDRDGANEELWVMLYEKAYAQWQGSGSYKEIEGGTPATAMKHITGASGDWSRTQGVIWDMSFDSVADHADKGHALVASSLPDSDGKNKEIFKNGTLVTGHAYWIESVDRDKQTVTVRNPWGWTNAPITLPWDDFKKSFWRVSYNETK